jgi:hypothetical protein
VLNFTFGVLPIGAGAVAPGQVAHRDSMFIPGAYGGLLPNVRTQGAPALYFQHIYCEQFPLVLSNYATAIYAAWRVNKSQMGREDTILPRGFSPRDIITVVTELPTATVNFSSVFHKILLACFNNINTVESRYLPFSNMFSRWWPGAQVQPGGYPVADVVPTNQVDAVVGDCLCGPGHVSTFPHHFTGGVDNAGRLIHVIEAIQVPSNWVKLIIPNSVSNSSIFSLLVAMILVGWAAWPSYKSEWTFNVALVDPTFSTMFWRTLVDGHIDIAILTARRNFSAVVAAGDQNALNANAFAGLYYGPQAYNGVAAGARLNVSGRTTGADIYQPYALCDFIGSWSGEFTFDRLKILMATLGDQFATECWVEMGLDMLARSIVYPSLELVDPVNFNRQGVPYDNNHNGTHDAYLVDCRGAQRVFIRTSRLDADYQVPKPDINAWNGIVLDHVRDPLLTVCKDDVTLPPSLTNPSPWANVLIYGRLIHCSHVWMMHHLRIGTGAMGANMYNNDLVRTEATLSELLFNNGTREAIYRPSAGQKRLINAWKLVTGGWKTVTWGVAGVGAITGFGAMCKPSFDRASPVWWQQRAGVSEPQQREMIACGLTPIEICQTVEKWPWALRPVTNPNRFDGDRPIVSGPLISEPAELFTFSQNLAKFSCYMQRGRDILRMRDGEEIRLKDWEIWNRALAIMSGNRSNEILQTVQEIVTQMTGRTVWAVRLLNAQDVDWNPTVGGFLDMSIVSTAIGYRTYAMQRTANLFMPPFTTNNGTQELLGREPLTIRGAMLSTLSGQTVDRGEEGYKIPPTLAEILGEDNTIPLKNDPPPSTPASSSSPKVERVVTPAQLPSNSSTQQQASNQTIENVNRIDLQVDDATSRL